MTGQLDIFHQPVPVTVEPEPVKRSSQISQLPGDTFEDIFARESDEPAVLREEAA